jgi:ABC-type arginine transport system ATPase subunit
MAKAPPLVFEELQDQSNLIFLTLVEYKRVKYLTVIENVIEDEIQAYVLDQLSAEGIDQEWFLSVATIWFYGASDRYPLSFEFAKLKQSQVARKVLKTFNLNSTSRVIGKLFTFPINSKPKIKRRKVNFVQETQNIVFKK